MGRTREVIGCPSVSMKASLVMHLKSSRTMVAGDPMAGVCVGAASSMSSCSGGLWCHSRRRSPEAGLMQGRWKVGWPQVERPCGHPGAGSRADSGSAGELPDDRQLWSSGACGRGSVAWGGQGGRGLELC
jgi:hypothetical protein